MPLAPGTALGHYVIVAPLGAGGVGEVYRARDPRLGREVAIKVLPPDLAADASRLNRFETEARAAAALNHPNVLSVHDVSAEGTPFVVFELLEGETLRDRAMRDLSPRQAVDYACQIARGFAAAHDKGVTHRDLKPDNVFVTRDVLRDDPPPAAPGRPLAPALDRLVRRCLAKRPEDRFQSARDLLFALEAVGWGSDPGVAPPEALVPSIAVLPFVDMSPGRDQDYFCEGLADELINALTRLKGVRVTSRTSSFQFRGTSLDVRTIGERLKVRTVLEGSVRKAGDRLRIIVQLIHAEGSYHLWSERYDRELKDVFAIQDEIAESVARALSVVLSDQERDALQRRPTSSLEAYEFYLKGRRFLARLSLELRLAACLKGGWGNRDWIAHDPDFDTIRDDPRFQALLEAPPGGSSSGF